jgi:hypothetical protein
MQDISEKIALESMFRVSFTQSYRTLSAALKVLPQQQLCIIRQAHIYLSISRTVLLMIILPDHHVVYVSGHAQHEWRHQQAAAASMIFDFYTLLYLVR